MIAIHCCAHERKDWLAHHPTFCVSLTQLTNEISICNQTTTLHALRASSIAHCPSPPSSGDCTQSYRYIVRYIQPPMHNSKRSHQQCVADTDSSATVTHLSSVAHRQLPVSLQLGGHVFLPCRAIASGSVHALSSATWRSDEVQLTLENGSPHSRNHTRAQLSLKIMHLVRQAGAAVRSQKLQTRHSNGSALRSYAS